MVVNDATEEGEWGTLKSAESGAEGILRGLRMSSLSWRLRGLLWRKSSHNPCSYHFRSQTAVYSLTPDLNGSLTSRPPAAHECRNACLG